MTKEKFPRVPYGSTVHGQEEIDAVISVLKEATQMGARVNLFENKIAQLFEKKYGLMKWMLLAVLLQQLLNLKISKF